MSQTTSPTSVPPSATGASQNYTYLNPGASSAPPSVQGSGNPIISQDQSAFNQYALQGSNGVGTYPVTLGTIPGVANNGTMTIGQALQGFMDMPPSELASLEMQLFDAGYYIDSNGQPINAQDIRFGVPGDPASWTAFARALAAASTSGTSLEMMLQSRQQSGASVNNALPSPVTGGGHTYTIDLSNPTEVKYTADQIFQSALGRNATAAEVSNITGALRSQQTAQGLAQEQGSEQQSRQAYQTQVNQRNIAYESETNPNLGGQIPSGPFNNPEQWATALLSYMHMPVTSSNVAAISQWAQATGKWSDGSFNPLGTQRPEGGSTSGAGGVQQFQNWAQGLEGTASMLMNGHYQGLVSALQSGTGADAVKNDPTVKQELSNWSGGKVGSLTVSQQTAQSASQASFYWNNTNQGQSQAPPGTAGGGGNAASFGANGGGPSQGSSAIGALSPQTVQAANSNPQVAGYLAAMHNQQMNGGFQTVSPNDVNQGQQPPNPGDAYINPVTVYDTSPASESSQAYQEATTGANRIPYAGNTFLSLYNDVLAMVKAGGPTAG